MKEDVDTVLVEVKFAGAEIVKPAQDAFWAGNQAIFATWMVTCGRWLGIPGFLLDESGAARLPD